MDKVVTCVSPGVCEQRLNDHVAVMSKRKLTYQVPAGLVQPPGPLTDASVLPEQWTVVSGRLSGGGDEMHARDLEIILCL